MFFGDIGLKLREVLQKFYKGVYERNYTCYLCRSEVFAGEIFCEDCKKSLPYNFVFCPRCGRKIVQEGYCADCKANAPAFDKARSVFVYEGSVTAMVYAFKNGQKELAEGLAEEALPITEREFSDADIISFVPMTVSALKKRGYNQSEAFARALSERTGIVAEALFEKTRDTPEQKNLTKAEREKNLRGAFRLKKRALCAGKRILLVDDALTTGATADELSKLLRGAKADKIYLLTIASVCLRK